MIKNNGRFDAARLYSQPKKEGTSRYLGVCVSKHAPDYFLATFRFEKRTYFLGNWRDEALAALARDRVVLFFGAPAVLNFKDKARELGPRSPDDTRERRAQGLIEQPLCRRRLWQESEGRQLGCVYHGSKRQESEDCELPHRGRSRAGGRSGSALFGLEA